MPDKPLAVESERLRAIATLNGRSRSNLFVYARGDSDTPLLAEDLNLANSEQRSAVVLRLDEGYHGEAETLLSQLAAVVAAERTKPRAVPAEADCDPFRPPVEWDEEVNGATLLDELCQVLAAHVVLPDHAAPALALWVVHTYLTDVTDYTPYILVTSPVRECGKSTLLEVLFHLANRAKLTSGVTAAALYRIIERHGPTMLLDELETRLRGDSGELLRGVLNSGFHRLGTVTVCVGDEHDAREFKTFCPKVLAGIGRVWDTVTSRSIPVRLSRASREQLAGLTKIRGDRIEGVCLPYRRRLLRWARDARDTLAVTDAATPTELGARQCDVWRPLLAIADVAGGHWPMTAREAALQLHGVVEDEGDYGLLLLEDLRDLFRSLGTDSVFSAKIVEEITKREDRPWPEYRGEKPITTRGIASLLGRFQVKPKTVRVGPETAKGYSLADVGPVFQRYLPTTSSPSVTSVTPAEAHEAPAPLVTLVTDENQVYGAQERLEGEPNQPEMSLPPPVETGDGVRHCPTCDTAFEFRATAPRSVARVRR